MNLITRIRELLTEGRLRWFATGIVATVVTLVVAVPLISRAFDARNDDSRPQSGPTDGIIATLGATVGDLEGSTVSGTPVITFELDRLGAIAYRLLADDGTEVAAGLDEFGPDFSMVNTDDGLPAGLDTSLLADGEYTIFATFTLVDGGETSETYRMATFQVDNSG